MYVYSRYPHNDSYGAHSVCAGHLICVYRIVCMHTHKHTEYHIIWLCLVPSIQFSLSLRADFRERGSWFCTSLNKPNKKKTESFTKHNNYTETCCSHTQNVTFKRATINKWFAASDFACAFFWVLEKNTPPHRTNLSDFQIYKSFRRAQAVHKNKLLESNGVSIHIFIYAPTYTQIHIYIERERNTFKSIYNYTKNTHYVRGRISEKVAGGIWVIL